MQGIPMIIFKGTPALEAKPCGDKNTITHAIHHKMADMWGNYFPSKDKCYITVSKTANSSGLLALDWIHNVYMAHVGAEDG